MVGSAAESRRRGVNIPTPKIAFGTWASSSGSFEAAPWSFESVPWRMIRDPSAKLDRLITHEFAIYQVAEAKDDPASAGCDTVPLHTACGEPHR